MVAALVLCIAPAVAAQNAIADGGADGPVTTWSARNWTRIEWWRFFEPPAGGGENAYAYPATRLQVSAVRRTRKYVFTGALQYVHFANLPENAVGPGPLGLGAVYFAHAGQSDSHQVYLRYLNLQMKDVVPGITLQVGRMPYSSGAERPSGNPKIELVKHQRVAARIVGEFEWSLYQRAYDGVRIDSARGPVSAAFVAFHPTQGGFEDAAGLMMTDVTVLGGSVTVKPGAVIPDAELQGFAFRYNDHREVAARPDNTGLAATRADVGISTFGGTLIAASPSVEGRQWDGLIWFAGQTGSWFGQPHRAASVVSEIGHQWGSVRWQPWVRGGLSWASGDRDPLDHRHGTFFQMLPTVRRYSQSAMYSQMNNTDLFAQVLLRPAPSFTFRSDLHRVGLASSRDRWYFGSGATQARGTVFGFSTRPSGGQSDLGTVVEASGDYAVRREWSVNAYVGVVRGGQVVRSAFQGRTTTFAYVENVVQF